MATHEYPDETLAPGRGEPRVPAIALNLQKKRFILKSLAGNLCSVDAN